MATFNVNGRALQVAVEPDTPLLWVLRDELGLTGTKYGCGVAQCGACTVHVDGQAVRSCVMPATAVGARQVTTIEGVSGKVARAVQEAWNRLDVVQCGYCQSGQIMSAVALLTEVPRDDRPRQGEGRAHQPPVRSGADGAGVPGLRCAACHGEANYDAVGMPGLAGWHLAPTSMGLRAPLPTICAQLKDPDKNGSRSLDDVVKHVANDPLVVWAWTPGPGRRPAPGTHATFSALIRAWADTGAECPP